MPIGHAFIELGSVDSTNDYAMARVHAGSAIHGTIFFAHEQWAGKGQRGRKWDSRPGENIVMSVVLEPAFLPVARQWLLNAAVALACHDLLEARTGPGELSIKWPNDLYWRDRKAGGILIENVLRGSEWLFSIVGIGINLNQTVFPETLQNPVSLKQINGQTFDAVEMARALGTALERRFEQLRAEWSEGAGAEGDAGSGAGGSAECDAGSGTERGTVGSAILEAYNERLYKRGSRVILKAAGLEEMKGAKDGRSRHYLIVRVTETGELLVRDEEGREHVYRFGDVLWVM